MFLIIDVFNDELYSSVEGDQIWYHHDISPKAGAATLMD